MLTLRPSPISSASLADIESAEDGIRLSELDGADGDTMFRHACELGLEGIVTKRRDRPYRGALAELGQGVKNPDAPAATRLIER